MNFPFLDDDVPRSTSHGVYIFRNLFDLLECPVMLMTLIFVIKFKVIFIAGRPKAALLFWFFGDFRCGALLFMLIHVIYKYKNR